MRCCARFAGKQARAKARLILEIDFTGLKAGAPTQGLNPHQKSKSRSLGRNAGHRQRQ
jgi:hypothetical protein